MSSSLHHLNLFLLNLECVMQYLPIFIAFLKKNTNGLFGKFLFIFII